ncbi:MAG: DVUA0089 family protein [Candidatus Hodarchaeales archaeon]
MKVVRVNLIAGTWVFFILFIPFVATVAGHSREEYENLEVDDIRAMKATKSGKKTDLNSRSVNYSKLGNNSEESIYRNVVQDSYEPDNDFLEAKEIALNSTQTHSIDPVGDIDICKFELDSETLITTETNGPADSDTVIYLFDSNYTLLGVDDDNGSDLYSRLEFFLLSGQYYIRTEEYNNNSLIESYSITLSAITQPESLEPNDSFANATYVQFNSSITERIYPAGDVDIFRFQLEESNAVYFRTTGLVGDTLLYLYDSNFTLLATDNDSGNDRFSLIYLSSLGIGVYYIKVEEKGNDSTINAYTIEFTFSTNTIGDSYEPDNNFMLATLIELNTYQFHSIDPVLDQDYLKFELSTVSAVTIETSGLEGSDTVIYLYDSNYSLLATDDDSGTNSYSLIQNTLLQPGLFYIMVKCYYGSRTIDNYKIMVSALEVISGLDGSNDSFAQAVEINFNTSISGSINQTGDRDYYSFQVETKTSVTISTSGLADGDTVIYLYKEQQTLLTSDDDSGSGSYSLIEDYSLVPGKYYIAIEEYGNDDTIDLYILSLTNRTAIKSNNPFDDSLFEIIIIIAIIIIIIASFFTITAYKSRINEMNPIMRMREASRAREEYPVEYERYTRRSSRRYIKRYQKPVTEIVDQPVKTVYGKSSDTCWSCGCSLPVDSLICPDCGFKRVKCLICKRNINFGREIGVCPVCQNKFHFGHLAETVKIFGKCPICRNSVKRYEIQIEKIVE